MIGLNHIAHERQSRTASLALGGKAALKNSVADFRRDARAGVVHAEQQAALALADADSDLAGNVCWGGAHGVKGVFDQIAKDGNQTGNRHILSISQQNAAWIKGKANVQLRRAIRLADEQGGDRRIVNAVADIINRLHAGLCDTQHIFLGALGLAQLQQTENDMQLIRKFMGIGAQRFYNVLYAGEILRELGRLGAVAENGNRALNFSVAVQRNAVRDD